MKHLALNNFLESGLAKRFKIDNFPTFSAVESLSELVTTILDPLTEVWGHPLHVCRGFMTERLNSLNGIGDTIHVKGYAADIVPLDGDLQGFIEMAESWLQENDIAFDQAYEEMDRDGNHFWHIAIYSENGEQRKIITSNSEDNGQESNN